MKHNLLKFSYVILAFWAIVLLFVAISECLVSRNDTSISFTPAESGAEDMIVMDDEIPDVFAGPADDHQDSFRCNYEDHVFDEPQFITENMLLFNYIRIDVCTICGYEARSCWTIYIPEGTMDMPAPGGENDIFLGMQEGFSCE